MIAKLNFDIKNVKPAGNPELERRLKKELDAFKVKYEELEKKFLYEK